MSKMKDEYQDYKRREEEVISARLLAEQVSARQQQEQLDRNKNEYKQVLLSSEKYKELQQLIHSQELRELFELIWDYNFKKNGGFLFFIPHLFFKFKFRIKIEEKLSINPWLGSEYEAKASVQLDRESKFTIRFDISSYQGRPPQSFSIRITSRHKDYLFKDDPEGAHPIPHTQVNEFKFNNFEKMKLWVFDKMTGNYPIRRGMFETSE
ncbi:MAG TPA: hypothetical protein VF209_05415 [Patescibacteria group bacterium]